jgi:hypothetical protein
MLVRSTVFLAVIAATAPAQAPGTKLVGVWYAGPDAKLPATSLNDQAALRRDLERIRRAGFNSLTAWIPWAEAQPQQGADLSLAPFERLIALAVEQDLSVSVGILTAAEPAWAGEDRAAPARFVDAVRSRLAPQRGVRRVEVVKDTLPEGVIEVGPAAGSLARARLAFWSAIAGGAGDITFARSAGGIGADLFALGETAGVVTRNEALFVPLQPRTEGVREISGGGGAPVEVRLLESAQALMIIALNRAAVPRSVRIGFAPDIPEAIWQNLETGAAVNFVMEPKGPFLEHSFAPHDALVLMIRKTLR